MWDCPYALHIGGLQRLFVDRLQELIGVPIARVAQQAELVHTGILPAKDVCNQPRVMLRMLLGEVGVLTNGGNQVLLYDGHQEWVLQFPVHHHCLERFQIGRVDEVGFWD
jgi:hypothetical protein